MKGKPSEHFLLYKSKYNKIFHAPLFTDKKQ